jgi:hypothetical protein
MYPVTILKQSGRAGSRSGGKDYHLVMLITADGRALYIQRWGKARQWGHGWKCQYVADATVARAAYQQKFREKLDREYSDHFINKSVTVNDEAELRKELGHQYVAEIGADNWRKLLPDFEVNGMKDGRPETEFVEDADGNMRIKERARKLVATPEPEPEPIADRVKSNPNWGIWG